MRYTATETGFFQTAHSWGKVSLMTPIEEQLTFLPENSMQSWCMEPPFLVSSFFSVLGEGSVQPPLLAVVTSRRLMALSEVKQVVRGSCRRLPSLCVRLRSEFCTLRPPEPPCFSHEPASTMLLLLVGSK
ncbi:hypothetical protein PDJAM_G00164620 [Pangasius djambal]|uniref:Uncharacterized protein n=1 Tax=Pangasius djambal TaxID=1691987 RepID=A0ACC5ZK65_9TELE|nr:hypothetical protein [Pangasius djambal]